MARSKIILILIIGFIIPLGACLNLKQPRNKIEYYTLEYEPPFVGDFQPLTCVIKVGQFSVSPIYNTKRIIYRDNAFTRSSYAYYKWRANPGDFVTYCLGRDLKQSGLFKAVLLRGSKHPASYIVEGTVDEFLEMDAEDGWEAILAVSIVFMVENESDINKKFLFQKSYRMSKPCQHKNPRALAAAMSQAMSYVSSRIITDIYNCLEGRK
jgi:ABC-type uncharacterized transport system auxiliary subunit